MKLGRKKIGGWVVLTGLVLSSLGHAAASELQISATLDFELFEPSEQAQPKVHSQPETRRRVSLIRVSEQSEVGSLLLSGRFQDSEVHFEVVITKMTYTTGKVDYSLNVFQAEKPGAFTEKNPTQAPLRIFHLTAPPAGRQVIVTVRGFPLRIVKDGKPVLPLVIPSAYLVLYPK